MEKFVHELKVLEEEQLKVVNNYIDELEFNSTSIFDANGKERIDDSVRSSTGTVMINDHPATGLLHEKLNMALIKYKDKLLNSGCALDSYPIPGATATSSHREGIQVLEYTKHQKYNWHYDACTDPNNEFYHRQISIVLYLTNDFEGGTTQFKFGGKYKPKPGYALFFPSNWCFAHCSTPVTSGKKRVAVTWYFCKDHMID
jgi:hypothetical protein|tara:strand:+ start:667 stop:1269 length:603 start_codon:yes stop_codon:yes gene_type:complete